MAVYIAKNAYFDTMKEIKINRVLPIKAASIYRN